MSIDLKIMRPGKLAGLLNSTRLGEVTNDQRVRRHIIRAGLRVGDSTRVDVLGYAAWLVATWYARRGPGAAAGYEALRAASAARNRRLSAAGRDITPLPAVANSDRRAACEKDFRRFCETYFPAAFALAWSGDHLKVIAKIEAAVLRGGQFAEAMPRGSGKTTLAEVACIWAILYAHRRFVCLIGATAARARSMLESIKTEFECNDALLEDFPASICPIRRLERIHNRAGGQTLDGEPTRIIWTVDKVVMPTVAGSPASGAILVVTGISSGNIRGQKHKLAEGHIMRPDLAIIDDPQTTKSAWSESQSARREALLAGDVLGMAGPGKKIAAILCATVIRPGDMADSILNRDKHPEWQGERMKMVYAFPTNEKLWDEYAKIRAESLKADGDGHEATEFYAAHRAEMDEGAIVAWPARHNPDEVSAIQHAMNLKLRDEQAFWAEYQNEPLALAQGDEDVLSADQIAAKTSGRKRGEMPLGANHLTMFIDVHDRLLYWMACAWEDDFTGYIVDYGAYPDQRRQYFTLRDARATLARAAPGTGKEGAIQAGLKALADAHLAREWKRDDGAVMQVGRCLVDAGYVPDTVYLAIRRSGRAAVLMPSKGIGVGASSKPFAEYKRRKGNLAGHYWRVPTVRGTRELRTVHIDTNYWKSFVHARLAVAMGDRGCLSIFGTKAEEHRLLSEHLAAEYRVRTEARGRTVDEWKLKASAVDNHWLDCLVGCAAAASMLGVSLFRGAAPKKVKRNRKHVAYL
jgi:hypothetical protein